MVTASSPLRHPYRDSEATSDERIEANRLAEESASWWHREISQTGRDECDVERDDDADDQYDQDEGFNPWGYNVAVTSSHDGSFVSARVQIDANSHYDTSDKCVHYINQGVDGWARLDEELADQIEDALADAWEAHGGWNQ
jgi:hypothetical protein